MSPSVQLFQLTMEIPRRNLAPCFFQFSPKPTDLFEIIQVTLEAPIRDLLMVQPLLFGTQSCGENTKSPIQDFIDFALKPYLQLINFHRSSMIICYFHIILSDSTISLYVISN